MTIVKERKRTKKSKFAQVKHPFLYRLIKGDGSYTVHKAWARVRHARKSVEITLTAAHVRKAMKRHGIGDTAKCSMAICTYNHADAFPHPVEGHVDWQYARCFIVTKLDRHGLPSECVAYEHNDKIARLNDTENGQRKLLEMIERDGPITVSLHPVRYRSEEGRPGRDRKPTGKRDPVKQLKGAKLRYSIAQLGAQPALRSS